MPRIRATVLCIGLAAASGCATPVGRYFTARARDAGECVRVETGLAVGLGAGVRVGGVLHAGALVVMQEETLGVGWSYGRGHLFGWGTLGTERMSASLFLGPYHYSGERGPPSHILLDLAFEENHRCCGLPGLFSQTAPGQIPGGAWRAVWAGSPATPQQRRERVHLFDLELEAAALIIGVRIGFSPGEFVDFVLGWFGLDIAGDDG